MGIVTKSMTIARLAGPAFMALGPASAQPAAERPAFEPAFVKRVRPQDRIFGMFPFPGGTRGEAAGK